MNSSQWKTLGITAALLLLGAAGCTDPTVAPKSSVSDVNFFKDPSSYQSFIAKVYAGLALSGQQGPSGNPDILGIDEGFSQYLRLYWEHEELPTDEAVIAWGDIGLPEMNTQTWTSSSNMVVAMYYRIFFQASMANEFLRQTTSAQLAARGNVNAALKAQIQQYRAEARFLRALSYWHGIDLFGNIPLVTENDPLATVPTQSTRAALYTFAVSELTAIHDSLPPVGPAAYGRATAPAADMLLAELYLNAGVYTGTPDYTDALAAAQRVISFSSPAYKLDSNYRFNFMADNRTSPEIIFAIPQDGVHTQTYGGVTFLVHASVGGSMSAANYGIDGGWYGLRLKPQADSFYSAGDTRASYLYTSGQTVGVADIGTFNDGIAAPKFTNVTSLGKAGSNPGFVDTWFPVFRLGEAYLIYAEAQLRGGGGSATQALAYVDSLRRRAFGDTTHFVPAAQFTVDTVLAERGRELLWEAHRRTDLVRYGKFTGGSYLWAWKGGVLGGNGTDTHLNLYPLPASELVANPNLKQNPGY
jgi:hypothetical protein